MKIEINKRTSKQAIVGIGIGIMLMLVIAATTVTPGLRISEYPNTTSPNANDLFLLADITSVPRTNRNYKWSSLTNFVHSATTNDIHIAAGTNVTVTTNVSGNVITYTISVTNAGAPLGYQTNAWTTNVAGTPVLGASNLGITNATTNFNFYGLNSNTVARLWEIGQATNGLLEALTNFVNSATNTILATVTNIANVASTNNVKVTAGTNIVVITNINGNTITYQVNNTIDTNIFATTNFVAATVVNFINLSVQAAKLPNTNYPGIDAGWQNWELLFPPTNSVGFTNPLVATWQFVCPTNYTTNSMKVYGQSIILSTNGPTSTNIYWRASFLKATPGDATDVHVGSFGSSVTVTQTWAASNTGTNKVQDFLIDMGTSSLLQRNDFAILKLERVNDIADTNQFKGSASLIGLQLRY